MEDKKGFLPEAFCSNCKFFKIDVKVTLDFKVCCSPNALTKVRVKKHDYYCPFHEFENIDGKIS